MTTATTTIHNHNDHHLHNHHHHNQVIARANKNNYGLAAAVFTKDVSNALFMSNRSNMTSHC